MKKMNKKIVICLIMVAVLVSLLSVTASPQAPAM